MSIVVTKKEGGGGYDEGWKTVTISSAQKGDYNGSKFIDLWFEGYPESLKCRVWEARSGEGEEFSISDNGYSEVAQKVAPAKPFQNIVDNFDENRIARIKEAAERYINNRKTAVNGTSTQPTAIADDEAPWD